MNPEWSAQATLDLIDVLTYIASDSMDAAYHVAVEIEKTCARIARQPGLGVRRDAIGMDVRAFPLRNYLIFYRECKGRVLVLRLLHGARDIDALFDVSFSPLVLPALTIAA